MLVANVGDKTSYWQDWDIEVTVLLLVVTNNRRLSLALHTEITVSPTSLYPFKSAWKWPCKISQIFSHSNISSEIPENSPHILKSDEITKNQFLMVIISFIWPVMMWSYLAIFGLTLTSSIYFGFHCDFLALDTKFFLVTNLFNDIIPWSWITWWRSVLNSHYRTIWILWIYFFIIKTPFDWSTIYDRWQHRCQF